MTVCKHHNIVSIAALLVMLLCACFDAKAATPTQTVIHNRAEIAWFDTKTGTVLRTQSNDSSFTVGNSHRFELSGMEHTITQAATHIGLTYRIQNTGNVSDNYTLTVVNLNGDAGDLDNIVIIHDLNGNGIADSGEPVIDETSTILPGSTFNIVVTGMIPNTALENDQFLIDFVATGTSATQSVSTKISIIDDSFIAIDKFSTPGCDVETPTGSTIDYRIDFSNNSNQQPKVRTYVIDNVERQGLLIVDQIPFGTELLPDQALNIAPLKAIPLILATGATAGWSSYERWDGSNPALKIALFVPAENLGPGQSGGFEFTLRVFDYTSLGTIVEYSAGIDNDGDGQDEFISNTVCDRILTSEPELGATSEATITFMEPSLELRRSGAAPNFSNNDHFIEAGSARLDNGLSNYDAVRDGIYLELHVSSLPPGSFIGQNSSGSTFTTVKLESLSTGDTLQVIMLETFPGSAVYRTVRPVTLSADTRGNDGLCPGGTEQPSNPTPDYFADTPECVLSSIANDNLLVTFGNADAGLDLKDTIVVAPTGTVYDSHNLEPVPGATVSIIRANIDTPASVGIFDDGANASIVADPVTDEPLSSVTNELGVYEIPALSPGTQYYVHVEPPDGWLFPSEVAPTKLLGYDNVATSYGALGFGESSGFFEITVGDATPIADIPVDPVDRFNRLSLDKRALQVEAEPGDVIAYSLQVTNRTDEDQLDVRIADRLPFGFKLVAGTTRIDGEIVEEPDGAPGTELDFSLGLLEPGAMRELDYVLEATAGAIDSDGINVARASARTLSGAVLRSPESRARVRINRSGVLSDRAAVFGKVYIDSDCNNLQNDAEWPIGGVRLYLDDGSFAITDENGQYSLYGLAPGTRVLRADPLSVPEGLSFKPLDNANAAVGDSRFLSLSAGDFHRADFAVSCPLADIEMVFEEIRERNASIDGTWLLEEAEKYDPTEARKDVRENTSSADIDGDLSNGIINGPDTGRTRSEKRIEDEDVIEATNRARLVPAVATKTTQKIDPKIAVRTITTEQAKIGTWLWPENDTSLDGRFIAVVRAGVKPTLYIDGQPIPDAQIGERIENRREGAQIVAWYGIPLNAGLNKVEVRGSDSFGNTRVLASAEFKRPAMGTRMVLRTRTDTLAADGGRSVLPIEILVLDNNDYPAQGVHYVTLATDEPDGGSWLENDLQESEPGHQVRVDNGRATVHLKSSDYTGTVIVRANTNDMSANLRVFQVAALRPLFGVGLLEIGIVSNDIMGDGFAPTNHADGIEDGTKIEGRLSMFLKGRIRGDAQLTLSYDSEKDADTDLLRDIEPGAHYPIHGDASVRGYEAQSRSKLYAKIEKGKNSVMWGDYVTDNDSDVDDLARVQRVLTGFNSRYDNGRARFQLFAAQTEEARQSEEIPGNGTALLFRIAGAPIVANSEIVEIIVRDRENSGLVNSVQRLSRFSDYTIDSISGELSFSEPVSSFDDELNPVFVRVTYDQENGGEKYWVAGARARFELTKTLVVGASLTDDASPAEGGQLTGVYIAWRPNENTTVTTGVAHATHTDGRESGDAQRLIVEHRWGENGKRTTSLVAARATTGFDTADAGVGAGRRELRLEHRERLSPTLTGEIEATHSESLSGVELRSTAGVSFSKSINNWTLRGGARHIRQRTESDDDSFTTAMAGAERRFKVGGRNASADIEFEQDIARASRNRIGFGSRLQLHDHIQLTARYERQSGIYDFSSLGAQSTTETFSAGVESDVIKNTRLYSEYRMRSSIGGRDFTTASGIRGNYEIAPGLKVSPAIEIVNTISGDDSGDGLALSFGVTDLRNPNARATAQAEYRNGKSADYVGLRGSYAARINLDWTALVREDIRRQSPNEGEIDLRHAFTLGLARRPKLNNRHHMLFQLQWKVERSEGEASDRDVYVLSNHHNYQIAPGISLSGRIGGKRQTTFLSEQDFETAAYLADARANWDLNRRWSLDLRAGLLATGSGSSRRHALGIGVSHVLDRDLQLQFGYNISGFREEDLDPEGYDARGFRFGLRYKFNERPFNWLSGQ